MGEFNSVHNRAVWFDLYVDDLARAGKFYEAVLGVKVFPQEYGEYRFSVIEHSEGNGGCLVLRKPGEHRGNSLLLYLNANGRIRDAVAQVEPGGGKVIKDVHGIGPHGFRALIEDSEGNELALHSETDE